MDLIEFYDKQGIFFGDHKVDFAKQVENRFQSRRRLFDFLGLNAFLLDGKSIVEIGAGDGINSIIFAMWGAKVTAIEPRVNGLQGSVQFARENHLNIEFYFSDASELIDALWLKSRNPNLINLEGVPALIPLVRNVVEKNANGLDNVLFHFSYFDIIGQLQDLMLISVWKCFSQRTRRQLPDPSFSFVDEIAVLVKDKFRGVESSAKRWFLDSLFGPASSNAMGWSHTDNPDQMFYNSKAGWNLVGMFPPLNSCRELVHYSVERAIDFRGSFDAGDALSVRAFGGRFSIPPTQRSAVEQVIIRMVSAARRLLTASEFDDSRKHLQVLTRLAYELKSLLPPSDVEAVNEFLSLLGSLSTLKRDADPGLLNQLCVAYVAMPWGFPVRHSVYEYQKTSCARVTTL